MTYQTIMENEWATLRYDSANKIVHHTILQPIGTMALREVLNSGVEVLAKNHADKWLSDDRNNGELSEEDVIWGLQDWGPRAAKVGWKYWALVVPETVAGRAAMTSIVEAYYNMGVRVMVFTNVEDAHAWLVNRS